MLLLRLSSFLSLGKVIWLLTVVRAGRGYLDGEDKEAMEKEEKEEHCA